MSQLSPLQRGDVLGSLDALGHDGQAEVVTEVDGAAHQDRVVVVVRSC